MKRILWLVPLILAAVILAGGCAPLGPPPPRADFLAVCKAVAQEHGGKVTKQEFLAQAQNKAQAEKIFNDCDVYHRGYLTKEELEEPQKRQMIQEVIRLTEPSR